MIAMLRRDISPVLVLLLTVLWLVLNQSLSPGHIVLGALLGTLVAWGSSTLRPVQARLRRLDLAAGLVAIVLWDILRSNLAVTRIVLGLAGRREVRSGFVQIPLQLRDPHGLAVLAMIVTSTPGTVWVSVSPDGGTLTLHVLDLTDEQYWVKLVGERYESRLRRIFE